MARPEEVDHGWMFGKLFTLVQDFPGWDIGDGERTPDLHKGDTVKVVMVSRFGDCGITRNLNASGNSCVGEGYEVRCLPEMLKEI